jgi:hypothetical protein
LSKSPNNGNDRRIQVASVDKAASVRAVVSSETAVQTGDLIEAQ